MSERIPLPQWFPSIARTVADPSTLFPHQAEQLPETPLSGLRLPSRPVCTVSALALASRRLALTSHLSRSPLTSHLSHSPRTSRTHHSPLALTSRTHLSPLTHTYLSPSCCSFEPATCNASPPSPQHLPNPQHLPLQFSLPRSGDSRTHRAPLTSEPATVRPDSESHPDSELSKPRALPRSRDSCTHRAPLTSEPATPRPDSESHPDSQLSKPRAGEAPRQNPAAL
jgi:hypothetical protein